ncbi:MAG: site-2 protease family protein [Desulfobacterales bacterium]
MLPNFNLLEFIIIIVPLLIAVIAHEYAHGYVAWRLGDPTAKLAGRLSFNPVRHLDPVGSFLLPLILKLSGAPILFGYARPVPVNFSNLRPLKSGTLWVASAGVITNFFGPHFRRHLPDNDGRPVSVAKYADSAGGADPSETIGLQRDDQSGAGHF